MTPTEARLYADALIAAADLAESQGRAELLESDLDAFVAADNKARAELQAAIERHGARAG